MCLHLVTSQKASSAGRTPQHTYYVIGPALRTSTAKSAAFTAGCTLVRHSVSCPGTTVNVFWRRATLVSHARSGSAATVIRCSPRDTTFGTRATMGCGSLEKSVRIRPGADQAPSFPGALRNLNGGRTRFLIPAVPCSQRVLSGDPTHCR